MRKGVALGLLVLLWVSALAGAQANGKLQIHFIDVGQGDGALLISPQGETVLFDGGVLNKCDKPLSYLEQLGVTKIDYLVVSHYHSDHIGCTIPMFVHDKVPPGVPVMKEKRTEISYRFEELPTGGRVQIRQQIPTR